MAEKLLLKKRLLVVSDVLEIDTTNTMPKTESLEPKLKQLVGKHFPEYSF